MAGEVVRNRKVVLKRYVTGYPAEDDMEVVDGTVPLAVPQGLQAPALVLKNLYQSCDAWMRGRMSKREDLVTVVNDFVLGEALTNFGVSMVIDSTHPDYHAGDLVWGMSGWEEYTLVTEPASLVKINHPELRLSYYTGVLGMPGLTAFAGVFDVCKPKKGETFFVSAASGAVGQIVGQLAKLAGCYVVGSVGSDEKVSLLKGGLGFDDAINYRKEPDLGAALARCFPEGIDVYFDGVGGATLDAALLCMRRRGRVAVCGMVSQYNLADPAAGMRMRNLPSLVAKRVRMEGFNVADYLADGAYCRRFAEEMAGYLRDGRVKYVEDVAEGLESAPEALVGIFHGRHVGRKLIVIARE